MGISIQFVRDADGLLTQAGSLTLAPDATNGLLTGTTLGNVTTTYTYDTFGEMASNTAKYNGAAFFTASYPLRDALGRISRKIENVGGESHTYDYSYDPVGRLDTVHVDGQLLSDYDYDGNGNRLPGSYDAQDRLMESGGITYEYTANGELSARNDNGQITEYEYDVFGNLAAVTLPDDTRIEYVLDGRNRRVGKKVDGALVQGFLYGDQLKPVAEVDAGGAVLSRFVFASRENVPDYMVRNGVLHRLVTDHLGSVRLVVSSVDGSIVQRVDYDPFGNVTLDTNPGFQPFGFAGGLYDRDTKLVRFGARDYDPETGRWTAKDPILFGGGDTNLYGYTANDPINFIDPTGLFGFNVHFAIGYTAALEAGCSLADALAIGWYTALADLGTQSVAQAPMHSMTPVGQSRDAAVTARDGLVNDYGGTGSTEDLGRALHAIQDEFAAGHGFQEYDGSVSVDHLRDDVYPSPDAFGAAYDATLNILKGKCGCQ